MLRSYHFPYRGRIPRALLGLLSAGWLIASGNARSWASGNDEKPLGGVHAVLDALGANYWAPSSDKKRVERLTADLTALGPKVSKSEARKLAECVQTSMNELRGKYRVVWPPVLQNISIYYGLRQRGYCFQWTDALYQRLLAIKPKTLTLARAITFEGGPFENNCLVVGVPGRPLREAILIDGWRFSGRLVWLPVGKDHYSWNLYVPEPVAAQPKGKSPARKG